MSSSIVQNGFNSWLLQPSLPIHLEPGISSRSTQDIDTNRGSRKPWGKGRRDPRQRLGTLAVQFVLYKPRQSACLSPPWSSCSRRCSHTEQRHHLCLLLPLHIWASAPKVPQTKSLSAIPALPEGPGNTLQSALRCSTGERELQRWLELLCHGVFPSKEHWLSRGDPQG